MEASQLFDPGPRAERRRRAPLYTDGGVRPNHTENLHVRALYHTQVLGYDVPEGHVPTTAEAQRSRKARGKFNRAMAAFAEKNGLPQFGKLRPTAHSSTSPRTAHERAEDAARTPMRKFFAGQDMPHWVLTNVAATLCDMHGMALPGGAYTVQLDLAKYAKLVDRMREARPN